MKAPINTSNYNSKYVILSSKKAICAIPRQITNLIGLFCDLISGLLTKRTPIVVLQNFMNYYED